MAVSAASAVLEKFETKPVVTGFSAVLDASAILAASTIFYSRAQTSAGSDFREFSIREKCEGVDAFVARQFIVGNRNYPVSVMSRVIEFDGYATGLTNAYGL